MITEPQKKPYYIFHPHVRFVRGSTGAAIYELFAKRVIWIRERRMANALAQLALGQTIEKAKDCAQLKDGELENYLEVLTQLGLGFSMELRTATENYRPLTLRSQAEEYGLILPGGTLSVEICNECVYDCPWCTSKNILSTAACTCGVWHRKEQLIDIDLLVSAMEQLSYIGVEKIVIRGGEPFLEMNRLFEILKVAARLGFRCEVHTTGTLIDEDVIEKLKGLPLHLFLLIPGRDSPSFEKNSGAGGYWERFNWAVTALVSAGIPFSAKIPAALDNLEEAQETAAWATKMGAVGLGLIKYLPESSYTVADLGDIAGPRSPANMSVSLKQFTENGQSQFCFYHHYFISADGGVTSCIAERDYYANLNETNMAEIIRTRRLGYLWESARSQVPACRQCEFRYGCTACVMRTQQWTGTSMSRHWSCHYNPDTASWE